MKSLQYEGKKTKGEHAKLKADQIYNKHLTHENKFRDTKIQLQRKETENKKDTLHLTTDIPSIETRFISSSSSSF